MKTKKINFEKIQTLQDFLNGLKKNFDCENCKPGKIVKNTLARTILGYLNTSPLIAEKVRINCMSAENLLQFIESIEKNFNCEIQFSNEAKMKLEKNFDSLILLTNLKSKP